MNYFLLMEHASGFLKLVNEERPHIKEITAEQARERLAQNPQAVLLDVREDHEWTKGHASQAAHLGKGILERDLEHTIPEFNREIIMYCGGGYRSILTASAAKKMGYTNVCSLTGGYKAMVSQGWPMKSGD
jgi:rhodanese-related sulfurtransferase